MQPAAAPQQQFAFPGAGGGTVGAAPQATMQYPEEPVQYRPPNAAISRPDGTGVHINAWWADKANGQGDNTIRIFRTHRPPIPALAEA